MNNEQLFSREYYVVCNGKANLWSWVCYILLKTGSSNDASEEFTSLAILVHEPLYAYTMLYNVYQF